MSITATKRIFLSPPAVGARELKAVKEAFASGYIAPCGPQLDAFEKRLAALASRRYAIGLANGTAAIDLMMDYLGVDSSWTVIAPTLSFIATVSPAFHRGARLVFVDVEETTGCIDVRLLGEALKSVGGRKTLVIGVDLYGRCCDSPAIARLVRRFGAKFLLDAAESVGSTRRGIPSGRGGFAAIFSFNGNKVVTTSGGGALVTDSKALADYARKMAAGGGERSLFYEYRAVGYNYGLSNVLAAIGLGQLSRLKEILLKRRQTLNWYRRHWRGRMLAADAGCNCWLTVLLCESARARDALKSAFDRANIEARPVFRPLHLQPVFRKVRCFGGAVAKRLFETGICVPSGTGLTPGDFRRIQSVLEGK